HGEGLGDGQGNGHGDGHGEQTFLIDLLPDWAHPLMVLVVVAAIVLGGRTLANPVLGYIAGSQLREAFTAAALLLVIGVALAMLHCGLSPALGSFLAGVVLADSEYRHALEADIEPFKGLLLGLFFTSVGAGLDFALIGDAPLAILGAVAGLMLVKGTILTALGRLFRLPTSQALRFGLALPQAGEFGFVLVAFASQAGLFERQTSGFLLALIALSMLVTPLLFILDDRLVQPRFTSAARKPSQADADALAESEDQPVILAGLGRFGVTVLRYLKANGVHSTVLELDPAQIELVGRFGHKGFFGDAARVDLLEAAGAADAALLIVAVDDRERATEIVRTARRHFPHLRVLARARSMQHAYELMGEGAEVVERETFGSALELGADALRALGFRAHQAMRATRTFRRHEAQVMEELKDLVGDAKAYAKLARLRSEELSRLLDTDVQVGDGVVDHAFDTGSLRQEIERTGGLDPGD
ncbi:MAG: cation:proton antiporter, partial [Planctomycetota bacterium]